MSNVFEDIQSAAKALKIDAYATDIAVFAGEKEYDHEQLKAIAELLTYLKDRKEESIVNTLLKLSRLPLKEPKTFQGFDFGYIRTKDVDKLRSLSTLATLHANRNLAFIGPQGVGKTHLAMAYGRECCLQGYKTYFLKATELNQRFTEAVKYGREGSVVNGLVKPSCLIVDEIGRCVFNKENTRLFFDMVDRRYSKEGPNSMVFTSNLMPDKWCEFFNEDESLKCALDRIFDDAVVYMIHGESYRGKSLETYSITTTANKK